METDEFSGSDQSLDFETQTDILTLLENVKCHANSSSQKQAYIALATIVNIGEESQNYFRMTGGLKEIEKTLIDGSCEISIMPAAMYCFACAVKNNVVSKMKALSRDLVQKIKKILNTFQEQECVQAAAFLLACLVSGSVQGQHLALETGCIDELMVAFKNLVREDCKDESLWMTMTKTLGVCISNPQNESNQRHSCCILPHALKVVSNWSDGRIVQHTLTMMGLIVANNVSNQNRFRSCGGIDMIENLVSCLMHRTFDEMNVAIVIAAITALDFVISENEKNTLYAIDVGMVPHILMLLQTIDGGAVLFLLMALAHLLECPGLQFDSQMIAKCQQLMVSFLADTNVSQDDDFIKLIKYILTLCKDKESIEDDNESGVNHSRQMRYETRSSKRQDVNFRPHLQKDIASKRTIPRETSKCDNRISSDSYQGTRKPMVDKQRSLSVGRLGKRIKVSSNHGYDNFNIYRETNIPSPGGFQDSGSVVSTLSGFRGGIQTNLNKWRQKLKLDSTNDSNVSHSFTPAVTNDVKSYKGIDRALLVGSDINTIAKMVAVEEKQKELKSDFQTLHSMISSIAQDFQRQKYCPPSQASEGRPNYMPPSCFPNLFEKSPQPSMDYAFNDAMDSEHFHLYPQLKENPSHKLNVLEQDSNAEVCKDLNPEYGWVQRKGSQYYKNHNKTDSLKHVGGPFSDMCNMRRDEYKSNIKKRDWLSELSEDDIESANIAYNRRNATLNVNDDDISPSNCVRDVHSQRWLPESYTDVTTTPSKNKGNDNRPCERNHEVVKEVNVCDRMRKNDVRDCSVQCDSPGMFDNSVLETPTKLVSNLSKRGRRKYNQSGKKEKVQNVGTRNESLKQIEKSISDQVKQNYINCGKGCEGNYIPKSSLENEQSCISCKNCDCLSEKNACDQCDLGSTIIGSDKATDSSSSTVQYNTSLSTVQVHESKENTLLYSKNRSCHKTCQGESNATRICQLPNEIERRKKTGVSYQCDETCSKTSVKSNQKLFSELVRELSHTKQTKSVSLNSSSPQRGIKVLQKEPSLTKKKVTANVRKVKSKPSIQLSVPSNGDGHIHKKSLSPLTSDCTSKSELDESFERAVKALSLKKGKGPSKNQEKRTKLMSEDRAEQVPMAEDRDSGFGGGIEQDSVMDVKNNRTDTKSQDELEKAMDCDTVSNCKKKPNLLQGKRSSKSKRPFDCISRNSKSYGERKELKQSNISTDKQHFYTPQPKGRRCQVSAKRRPATVGNSKGFRPRSETLHLTRLSAEDVKERKKGRSIREGSEKTTKSNQRLRSSSRSRLRNVYSFYSSSQASSQEMCSYSSSSESDISATSLQRSLKKRRSRKKNGKRRARVPYNDQEILNLRHGVSSYGTQWQQILAVYQFHPSRTAVDLKEKFKRLLEPSTVVKRTSSSLAFSRNEIKRLTRGVKMFGHHWKVILAGERFLPGRTAHDLRDKWRSLSKDFGLNTRSS